MSAQSYTNKRRILAEAALKKVQYPGRVALNNKPILSALNCSPDFSVINYVPNRKCCIPTPPLPPCIETILDGGMAGTTGYIIYDGNCGDNCYMLSGGDAYTASTCGTTLILLVIYECGDAVTDSTTILSV